MSEKILQFLLLGDSGVGKSSVFNQITLNGEEEEEDISEWDPIIDTNGDWITRRIRSNTGESYQIRIMDTLSYEKYHPFMRQQSIAKMGPLISQLYENADGFMLIYDITNIKSFENLEIWLEEVNIYKDNAKIILLGNKSDAKSQRIVSKIDGEKFAKENLLKFMEISCYENINIEESLIMMVSEAMESQETWRDCPYCPCKCTIQ